MYITIVKGSDAGTSLKTMLMNLQPQTKAQKALFEELGLVTETGASKFYDASGKLRSLSDIAGLLQSSMSGLTDAQRMQAMETMFGSDAIRGANILFKEGANGVNTMKNAIGDVSAEDVARMKMDTFSGAVEKMKGSIETAEVAIGKNMIPTMRVLAGIVESMANSLANLTPAQLGYITALALLASIIGPVLLGISGLLKLFAFLQTTVVGFEMTMGAFLILGGEIIVIIMAIIAIGWMLASNWDQITNFFIWAWASIQSAWSGAGAFFAGLWSSIEASAQSIWGNIINFFTKTVPDAIQNLLDWFKSLPQKIGDFLSVLPEIMLYWFGFALGAVVRLVILMFINIRWTFAEFPGIVAKYLSDFYKTAVTWFNNTKWAVATAIATMFWNIINYLSQLPSMVSNYFSSMYRNTVAWINSLSSRAESGGDTIVQKFVEGFWNLPKTVYDVFKRVGDTISSWRSYLASRAQSLGNSLWQGFKDGLGIHSPSYIEQAFMNIATSANNTLSTIKSTVPKFQSALSGLSTPAMGLAGGGADYGFMEGTAGVEQNNFNIDTLVVREDADIYRIAKELYKIQQAQLRAQGR